MAPNGYGCPYLDLIFSPRLKHFGKPEQVVRNAFQTAFKVLFLCRYGYAFFVEDRIGIKNDLLRF